MLGAVDVAALVIKLALEPGALSRRHVAVFPCLALVMSNPSLASLQPQRLAPRQLVRADALTDAALLPSLAVVDAGRVCASAGLRLSACRRACNQRECENRRYKLPHLFNPPTSKFRPAAGGELAESFRAERTAANVRAKRPNHFITHSWTNVGLGLV
jgi:hypothetical protein